ncbi:MAG: thioredoxin domain-containing protein [Myxococcales bacterium]|nr:thioredoxin family protein [Polyangiaceae bacterium]MDW8249959.1 thioredoxin domain-containing protein [Myxococcales bacterium]
MHGTSFSHLPDHSLAWARSLIKEHGRDLARQIRQRGLSAQEGFASVEACLCAFLSLPQARQIASQADDTRRLISLLLGVVVQSIQVRGDVPAIPGPAGELDPRPIFDPRLIRRLLLEPQMGVCEELGLSAQDQDALRTACLEALPSSPEGVEDTSPWTEASFEQNLIQAEKPVLVHFVASWCKPCHMIAPFLQELAWQRQQTLLVVNVDVEKNPSLPVRYQVRALPTLLLFREARVVGRQVGAATQSHLTTWLDSVLRG